MANQQQKQRQGFKPNYAIDSLANQPMRENYQKTFKKSTEEKLLLMNLKRENKIARQKHYGMLNYKKHINVPGVESTLQD